MFATTTSFKRCTVLHNAFPVCTTVYVFQANSTRTLALPPSRPLQNTSTHHAVSSWLLDPGRYAVHTKAYYNGRIWKWTSQDLFCTEDWSRIAPGGASFFALDNCGNVRWECRFNMWYITSAQYTPLLHYTASRLTKVHSSPARVGMLTLVTVPHMMRSLWITPNSSSISKGITNWFVCHICHTSQGIQMENKKKLVDGEQKDWHDRPIDIDSCWRLCMA